MQEDEATRIAQALTERGVIARVARPSSYRFGVRVPLGDQLGDRPKQRGQPLERQVGAGHGHDPAADARLSSARPEQPRIHPERDNMHISRIYPEIAAYVVTGRG